MFIVHIIRRASVFALTVLFALGAAAQTPKPVIAAVVNAASYAPGAVSPGEMVVIFGAGLGPVQIVGAQLDSQGKVSTTLSEVQLLFDDVPAPLIYVSQSQVSAMVPYAVAGKAAVQVRSVYRGVTSDPVSKSVASTAVGVFTADASGKGQVSLSNSDGSINSSSSPAARGSYVTFYLTGE